VSDVHGRIKDFWDRDAETYDRSATHAASDPVEAAAWRAVLHRWLPAPPASVLDAGAGTGAISLLVAELGYDVTALDLSAGMLERAREKAHQRTLEKRMTFVEARADTPPAGPFDAVVERNMLWTNPDPLTTLEAWHRVTRPGGRLIVFEGVHGGSPGVARARGYAAEALRKALKVPPDHHAHYEDDLQEQLPLAGATSPQPLLDFIEGAGWNKVMIERLRDVEWARKMAAPSKALAELESVPLYAAIAEA
jgi:ubiquinone/menaquinone biosynthesis C-methylase UbiE